MDQCFFLGLYEFPGGTCAQWFAGSASTAAVVVALGANFYSAWRQADAERRSDAAEIAGISLLLRNMMSEADADAQLFYGNCKKVELYGENCFLGRPPGGVKASSLPTLNKNQADVLIRRGLADYAAKLDTAIGNVNLLNLGIEDFSRLRADFIPLSHKFLNIPDRDAVDRNTEDFKWFINRLRVVSSSTEHFMEQSKALYQTIIQLIEKFNQSISDSKLLRIYTIDTAFARERLADLKIENVDGGTK